MYFIDLLIMPSFYLGRTETSSLDSLLYRNPAAAGELQFPVLILQEHKDGSSLSLPCVPARPEILLQTFI